MLRQWIRRFRNALIPSGGLFQQTVRSGVWMGATTAFDRGLQVLLLVILARLLDPNAFGIMGIALLAIQSLLNLTNIGLESALIQRRAENVDDFLDTAWVLELLRGFVIAGTLFVFAPSIAAFFDTPEATAVLRVIALTPLLIGLRNPAVVYFQKDLAFHKEFFYRMSGSVSRFIVGVGYALLFRNVWALVLSYVAAELVRMVVSYGLHEYRPRPSFDVPKAKELVGYGKWITGTSILYAFASEFDDAVVGWVLTASALGYYQLSYRFARIPVSELSNTVTKVVMPSFSKLQDDPPALRSAVFRTLHMTAVITFPMAFGIAVVAPAFVRGIIGEQWLPMVPAMQLFAIFGLTLSVLKIYGAVWKAVGHPDLETKLSVLRVGLLAVLIYPATVQWGITGAAFATVVAVVLQLPVATAVFRRTLDTTFKRIAAEFAYPLLASAAMAGFVLATDWYVDLESAIGTLIVQVGVGVTSYLLAVGVLTSFLGWTIVSDIRGIIQVMRG